MKIDLVGPGYYGVSDSLNINRCINFIPLIDAADGKNSSALMGTPGLETRVNAGTDIFRGMHAFNNRIYFVAGNKLYSWTPGDASVSSQLGDDLNTSLGFVSMADNGLSSTGGDQLIIADGSQMYVWNVSTEEMTLIDIAGETVCFIGGYFMANVGGGKFRTSDLYDGITWNALNTATAEAAPDDLLSVCQHHGEAWLFGEYTTEIWYQIADGNPPFNRMSGGVIDYGCAAPFTIAQGNNSLIWLGNKRNDNYGEFIGVCMASGYDVKIISPPAINYLFSTFTTIDDAFAYCYTEEGHEYYVLTLPGANVTFCYDTTTGLWHERSSYKDNPYKIGRHRGNCYAHLNGRHYIGDYSNGNIYEMSQQYYDDAGDPIVSTRILPHLADKENLNNVFYHEMQLDAEQGTQSPISVTGTGYSIDTTNGASSTVVTLTVNGTEVFSTYLSEPDVVFSNPLPFILMIGLNQGLNNWPVDSDYWGEWVSSVTENGDGTCTIQLASHSFTTQPHGANIYAVMDPLNGITNTTNPTYPQYPDIKVRTNDPTQYFTVTLDDWYADNVTEDNTVLERTPKVILSWSDDNGKTWSNEHWADMGKQGEYNNRILWRRLGKSRNRVFKIIISDAIKKMLIGANIKLTKGIS
jgi:hypothetical protein